MTTTAAADALPGVGAPRWVRPTLDVREGRDPLGLQTTTQDRLTPVLLPGILELSRQIRYISFHSWLLATYRDRHFKVDSDALSAFIKAREWDYGLAVLRCPHGCGTSPVGAQSLRGIAAGAGPYPRGQSVKSAFGGYGLYYRSPMAELGLVARAGTLLGEDPIPIDVLHDSDRAHRLVETFTSAVAATRYAQEWMFTSDPLPADVLEELAETACLCQLPAHSDERDAVHDALFTVDEHNPVSASSGVGDGDDAQDGPHRVGLAADDAVAQRRRSIAHFLTLVEAVPAVVERSSAFRAALWSPPSARSEHQGVVAGQWAGLVAKDVWQDSLCSIWAEFGRVGLERTQFTGQGLTWAQTEEMVRSLVAGPPILETTMPTADLIDAVHDGAVTFPDVGEATLAGTTLEELRRATVRLNTASSGLVVLLELHQRAHGRDDPGWRRTATVRSAWQPSVAKVLEDLDAHLAEAPTVGDTLWWLVERYVISVHERIAYSKLPEDTFRFRWEDSQVRFFDNGMGRFPLAAIRHDTMSRLTRDLGFWNHVSDEPATLTTRGKAFVGEVFG